MDGSAVASGRLVIGDGTGVDPDAEAGVGVSGSVIAPSPNTDVGPAFEMVVGTVVGGWVNVGCWPGSSDGESDVPHANRSTATGSAINRAVLLLASANCGNGSTVCLTFLAK